MTPLEIRDSLIKLQNKTGGISATTLKSCLTRFEEAIRYEQKQRCYIAYQQYLGKSTPEQNQRLKRFILST